ncbi:LysM peptidoglycan-binding domain-containing protein [Lagierella sp.]|uniref:LysM peptidoglycan-binding domain-containing protein n=1 Tax=Lagierella sp. TaxID=2849657 RepID=UPI0026292234|nr:LysM peptidoglycan-binding domain-containing protein [Lagierella sp.]
MKKYRIVNKLRFFVGITSIILIATAIILLIFKYTLSKGNEDKPIYSNYTVKYSQTVWDIAEETNYRGDIRELVDEIIRVNELKDSTIYPGQVIVIPQ